MKILFALLKIAIVAATLSHFQIAQASELPNCVLVSEGIYNGSWVKHRIAVNNQIIYGTNDTELIFVQLDNLREQGLCR